MKNSIKVERAKLNITQTELAEKIQVTKQTIHSLETGRFVPSGITMLKIAKFFQTSVESIFELEDED